MTNDKYGSCGVPWWQGEVIESLLLEQQIEELENRLIPMVQALEDALSSFIRETAQTIKRLWQEEQSSYPNKRVVWLATHHKSERVRKKNIKRIMKWNKKNGKL